MLQIISKQETAFLTLGFNILLEERRRRSLSMNLKSFYYNNVTKETFFWFFLFCELVRLPEGLDLGGHFSSIFSVHQLCIGHQD